ncbi:hypothetical protein BKA58DRAFT_460128 [Alternaria rosae]|uniref:uncharacterized protein n=1 Tax=Alternaria rosae TaxID=1187941 RepID=UPI001E8CF8EF|nr:uncharacterized protein BKA58DRAFT_460128 [Alternaria rosae]KAH6866429.1 hypothetical protein BKA58DRAFT_460128 [Alternaria rosae]
MSSVTIDNDEPTSGRMGADMSLLRLFFGDQSFEEVERADAEENRKTLREEYRHHMKRDLSLPSHDSLTSIAVPGELVMTLSTWLKANPGNLAECPTRNYSPEVVEILADALFDPEYKLPDVVLYGETETEFHLQVYFCAVEMGMQSLQDFAFKFMKAALREEGLAPEELRNSCRNHGLFDWEFCEQAKTIPQHHMIMCSFATHIAIHEDEYVGNSVYASLLLVTKGWLAYYVNAVRGDVQRYIEALRRDGNTIAVGR